MDRTELLFQGTTLWLVAVVATAEIRTWDSDPFTWIVWAVAFGAVYLVPPYVLLRLVVDSVGGE